jgi:hypothetical protein
MDHKCGTCFYWLKPQPRMVQGQCLYWRFMANSEAPSWTAVEMMPIAWKGPDEGKKCASWDKTPA